MAGFSFFYFINSLSLLLASISYCNSLSDSSAAVEEGWEEKHPRVEERGWAQCPPEAE